MSQFNLYLQHRILPYMAMKIYIVSTQPGDSMIWNIASLARWAEAVSID